TKIVNVNANMQVGRTNGLAQSIIEKKSQLGDIADTHLESVFERLTAKQAEINVAIMRNRVKSDLQAQMKALKTRFVDFQLLVKAYTVGESIFLDKAKMVYSLVQPYYSKIMNSLQYLTCASYVSSLISDLDNAEMQAAINSMSYVSSRLTALRAAQVELIASHANFYDLRTQQVAASNASKLRAELIQLINEDLVDYLNAMRKVQTVDYSLFSNTLNGIIKSHNSILKRAKSSNLQEEDAVEETL
ncbi:MAG: hypothetical protein ACK5IJ_11000, partial [Mangrovibacterium sp.]